MTGAPTGIGRAIARELVERGCDIVVAADEAEIQQAPAELGALAGVGVSGRFDHTTSAVS